ncbi:MAG TPA: hypothetical protein VFG19_14895 [Geobacteraceae bacterium]|nr:hypothetical protein [Geobacteraceae bacterium]
MGASHDGDALAAAVDASAIETTDVVDDRKVAWGKIMAGAGGIIGHEVCLSNRAEDMMHLFAGKIIEGDDS